MKRLLVGAVCASLALAGAGCSDNSRDEAAEDIRESAEDAYDEGKEAVEDAVDQAEGGTVEIEDFAFKPATQTVKLGAEVTWVNRDDVDHTATAKDESFDGEVSGVDAEFSFSFEEAGEFEYFCKIHGEDRMSGKIVVE